MKRSLSKLKNYLINSNLNQKAISGFVLKFLGLGILFLSTLWVELIFNDTRNMTMFNSTTTLFPFQTTQLY